jgi:hypothetical protein
VMTTKIHSRFDHEVGGLVEGFVILEKRTLIPPDPAERRRGVYEYLVEVPPIPMKGDSARKTVPERGSFTRSTPEQRSGVVRRVPSGKLPPRPQCNHQTNFLLIINNRQARL